MTKIVLLCAAGMSTSALVRKMKDAAKAEDYECDISKAVVVVGEYRPRRHQSMNASPRE